MGTVFMIIVGLAIVVGIGAFIFSHESSPAERAKEAAGAAAGTAAMSIGCILQTILSAIPVLIGLIFLGLILRSCS